MPDTEDIQDQPDGDAEASELGHRDDVVSANFRYAGAWNEIRVRLMLRQNLITIYTGIVIPILGVALPQTGINIDWRIIAGGPQAVLQVLAQIPAGQGRFWSCNTLPRDSWRVSHNGSISNWRSLPSDRKQLYAGSPGRDNVNRSLVEFDGVRLRARSGVG